MKSRLITVAAIIGAAHLVAASSPACAADRPVIDPVSVHRRTEVCSDERCAEFSVRYLKITAGASPAVMQKMNERILARIREMDESSDADSIDERASEFIDAYKEFIEEESGGEQAVWNLTGTMSESFQRDRFLGLQYEEEGFTGGAHGFHKTILMNFDLESGRELSLDDVLGARRGDFMALAEEAFRRSVHLKSDTALADGGFFYPSGEFSLPREWAVKAGGIRLYYNEYEAAAYAQGPVDVFVSGEALRTLLSEPWKSLLSPP